MQVIMRTHLTTVFQTQPSEVFLHSSSTTPQARVFLKIRIVLLGLKKGVPIATNTSNLI